MDEDKFYKVKTNVNYQNTKYQPFTYLLNLNSSFSKCSASFLSRESSAFLRREDFPYLFLDIYSKQMFGSYLCDTHCIVKILSLLTRLYLN